MNQIVLILLAGLVEGVEHIPFLAEGTVGFVRRGRLQTPCVVFERRAAPKRVWMGLITVDTRIPRPFALLDAVADTKPLVGDSQPK